MLSVGAHYFLGHLSRIIWLDGVSSLFWQPMCVYKNCMLLVNKKAIMIMGWNEDLFNNNITDYFENLIKNLQITQPSLCYYISFLCIKNEVLKFDFSFGDYHSHQNPFKRTESVCYQIEHKLWLLKSNQLQTTMSQQSFAYKYTKYRVG